MRPLMFLRRCSGGRPQRRRQEFAARRHQPRLHRQARPRCAEAAYRPTDHRGRQEGRSPCRVAGRIRRGAGLRRRAAQRQGLSLTDSPFLPYVLDASLFASLDAKERRRVLFDLTGASASPAEVGKRLEAKGLDLALFEKVKPCSVPGSRPPSSRPSPTPAKRAAPGKRSPARTTAARRPLTGRRSWWPPR